MTHGRLSWQVRVMFGGEDGGASIAVEGPESGGVANGLGAHPEKRLLERLLGATQSCGIVTSPAASLRRDSPSGIRDLLRPSALLAFCFPGRALAKPCSVWRLPASAGLLWRLTSEVRSAALGHGGAPATLRIDHLDERLPCIATVPLSALKPMRG